MSSRVEKYYDNNTSNIKSRTERNNELYKEISKTNIDGYEVRSNATIIGNNSNNIDVTKIKSILDTHYNDTPKRRSIPIEREDKIEIPKQDETKEYDINVILDKAKESKIETYDEERSKKIHNTQFDILNNLDLSDYIEDYEKADELKTSDETAKQLKDLINTINLNESEIKKAAEDNSATDPLDIFSDLKGDENTTVLDGLQEKTDAVIEKMEKTTSLDNTFFTKSNAIKQTDFEDFKDIDDSDGPSVFMKIILCILLIAFVAGIVILVKTLM